MLRDAEQQLYVNVSLMCLMWGASCDQKVSLAEATEPLQMQGSEILSHSIGLYQERKSPKRL